MEAIDPPQPPNPNAKPRHDRIIELYVSGIVKPEKLRDLAKNDELLRFKLDRAGIDYS